MSAGGQVQAAASAALAGLTGLEGIFDGPPARARFPYALVDAGVESDWSHKSGEGREVLLAVTLWDEQPARLRSLSDDAEAACLAIGTIPGWELVTLRLVRRRTIRDVAGPWATAIDFRARLLAPPQS